MRGKRLLVFALVAAAVAAFFAAGGQRYLSFDAARQQVASVQSYYAAHPWKTAAAFFLVYVAVAGMSLPGGTVMTLAAGAIFGVLRGTIIVSFASSAGATVAFLLSRLLLRDWVQQKFSRQLEAINAGMRKEGALYLFTLRLIPQVPYFAVNLAMGLTPIRASTFYWVSQLGMFAGTVVYVNAGTQLSRIESPRDVLSWQILGALTLLGIFPLVAKKLIDAMRARRVYSRWKKPRKFDRNLVVIGAGSAGLVAAYIAAAVKAKVTLVEKHRMGGDCLNTGCVPSKALIKAARLLAELKNAPKYGIRKATAEFDFAEVMERVQRVIGAIEPHDSAVRYESLGVECLHGEARIVSPWEVEIRSAGEVKRLSTRGIVIAAGARPLVPPIPGIDAVQVLTSDSIWSLRELPRRLAVLGGGPIGCELAQAFARFGAKVSQVEMLPRLLAREDPEVSERVRARFEQEGIEVLAGHRAVRVEVSTEGKRLVCEKGGEERIVEFDALLCAVGRAPNTAGYGLEELGIPLAPGRTVQTNEFLQTLYPNIYACGDVAGPYQFTHVAAHQAWYASVNALFGRFRKFRADYSVIPWAIFTDPEVARVGLNEAEARERRVPFEVTSYGIEDLDRAIADGQAEGMVKVLTSPGKDRILGATVVGERAGDLIIEFISAMRHGIGLNRILGTIHIYPTFAEANKYAAGAWKKAHVPAAAPRWLERFHGWMRG